MGFRTWIFLLVCVSCLRPATVLGQIDPVPRELVQVGFNAALEGHPPIPGYIFYYRNQPEFLRTNYTLRLAVAPTYLDSEFGFSHLLGENTDLGVGLIGGGFAENYYEIRQGRYIPAESFDGNDGGANVSLYHLFNPGQTIPLYGVLRGTAQYVAFDSTSDTAPNFRVPDNMGVFSVRSGLRWGGRPPLLIPPLAMELSIWYQGEFRTRADTYGFGDRGINPQSHLFWAEAALNYNVPKWQHDFSLGLTAGTSINADRLSAYRLGGLLPLISEFSLPLPGYFYQELSARQFIVLAGTYIIPLEKRRRWNIDATAATALVDYLPGQGQAGNWNSGVGGGLFYTTPTWRIALDYCYGIDAIRTHGRGAHSIALLLQLDLGAARKAYNEPVPPTSRRPWLHRIGNVLGS